MSSEYFRDKAENDMKAPKEPKFAIANALIAISYQLDVLIDTLRRMESSK